MAKREPESFSKTNRKTQKIPINPLNKKRSVRKRSTLIVKCSEIGVNRRSTAYLTNKTEF
jgi:hypothetical protein